MSLDCRPGSLQRLAAVVSLGGWVVLSAACGSHQEPGDGGTDSSSPAAAASAEGNAAITHQYQIDAIYEGVENGRWRLGEAIVRNLELVTGGAVVDDVYRNPEVEISELTGLIQLASGYLSFGESESDKQAIRKLLDFIILRSDEMAPFSAPAPQQPEPLSRRFSLPEFLLPAAHADSDCDRQIRTIRTQEADTDSPCYDYIEVPNDHGGFDHRVYYPRQWRESGSPNLRLVNIAADSIRPSFRVFGRLGRVERVAIIFGAVVYSPRPEALAGNTYWGGSDPSALESDTCDITVFVPGLAQEENAFRQTIAHELFHCFQSWEIRPQYLQFFTGSGGLRATQWWVEGSAEYFSNAVFPRINDEWNRIGLFNARSPDTAIHHMSYENWIFFQHLANAVGDDGIIRMLKALPASGGSRQQADSLAGFSDMQNIFHKFGQDYLDGEIRDASGELVPQGDIDPGQEYEIDASQRFNTRRFVVHRARLKFPGGSPQTVVIEEEGIEGRTSVQRTDMESRQPWMEKPEDVGAGLSVCEAEEQKYRLLMTAADSGDERYRVELRLEEAEEMNKDLNDAAYRYRNFAEAMRYLDKGPSSMSPNYPIAVPDKLDPNQLPEDRKNKLHCHMSCSLRCICDNPQMHSDRVVTVEECYQYNPAGRQKVPAARKSDGSVMTRCEFQIQGINQEMG